MKDLTTLFCNVDDFWKDFKNEWEKHLISSEKQSRGPEPKLSISEMITIVIYFHQSNYRTFKHFYAYVSIHLKKYFPKLISYYHFVYKMKALFLYSLIQL